MTKEETAKRRSYFSDSLERAVYFGCQEDDTFVGRSMNAEEEEHVAVLAVSSSEFMRHFAPRSGGFSWSSFLSMV